MKRDRYSFSATVIFLLSLVAGCQFSEHTVTDDVLSALSGPAQFSPDEFKNPPSTYGPFTRWWWPGNDVTEEELRREVRLFAEQKFAGVEIQPFVVGINPNSSRLAEIYRWDTPAFYENLKTVMNEALKTDLIVDLNGGSGWPMGGSFLKPEESLLTLDAADTIVSGGHTLTIDVPALKSDYSSLVRGEKVVYNQVDLSMAKLISVVAAKVMKSEEGIVWLDSANVVLLNDYISSDRLNWRVPDEGQWQIIAFYWLPDGEKPDYIADKNISWVTDHLDSNAVIRSYEHLFGSGTGLEKYYGHPFRAIFNDSKEFITHRHISKDFMEHFEKKRGYDVRPWLAVNVIPRYNNAYAFGRDTLSPYGFSEEDWRLRYDYNLTINELYKEHFLNASRGWMEQRGLLHRTQEYGIRIDVIGASGLASIPEAEQLSAGGSEGFVKLVTSGAHLHNRPVIAQESFVFSNKAGMTHPEQLKAFANKSFAAGVNQLVYHGSSYRYLTEEYGREGWQAWSTPYRSFNYGSDINESNNYWKFMKEINTFIARSQYVMRLGKPKADVLIYYPFIDTEPSQMYRNPDETVISGNYRHHQPDVEHPTFIQKWFIDVWPLVNKLESMGITWDYVNDESLMVSTVDERGIQIRGNRYKGIILSNLPYIPLRVSEKMQSLAADGGRIYIYGTPPVRQPGFLNYRHNDQIIERHFKALANHPGVVSAADPDSFVPFADILKGPVRFTQDYRYIRQMQRELDDGGLIHFYWNFSDQVRPLSLSLDEQFTHNYWLNPEDGSIRKIDDASAEWLLQPYSSIVLYASKKKAIPERDIDRPLPLFSSIVPMVEIQKWNIKAGDMELTESALFDWRTNDQFRYLSDVGVYTSTFTLDKKKDKVYYLEMGELYYTAEVYVNNKRCDVVLWPPYVMDITRWVKSGSNEIEIVVTPTNRNYFVGQGVTGNRFYSNFKHLSNTLMPAGMVGPVVVSERTVED